MFIFIKHVLYLTVWRYKYSIMLKFYILHIFFNLDMKGRPASLHIYHRITYSSSAWDDNFWWFWHLAKHEVNELLCLHLYTCTKNCHPRLHYLFRNKSRYISFYANLISTKVISNFYQDVYFTHHIYTSCNNLLNLNSNNKFQLIKFKF